MVWQKRDDSNQYFHRKIRLLSSFSYCAIISRNPLTHSIDLASTGEIPVDEAKRSYDLSSESAGLLTCYNPFYVQYTPDEAGNSAVNTGHCCIIFEKPVDAVTPSWR